MLLFFHKLNQKNIQKLAFINKKNHNFAMQMDNP